MFSFSFFFTNEHAILYTILLSLIHLLYMLCNYSTCKLQFLFLFYFFRPGFPKFSLNFLSFYLSFFLSLFFLTKIILVLPCRTTEIGNRRDKVKPASNVIIMLVVEVTQNNVIKVMCVME